MIAAKTVFRLFALVAFIAVLPPLAHAAEPIALRVVFVQTDNSSAYLAEIEKGKALMKKLDVPAQLRVWKARFAGNDKIAGLVHPWPVGNQNHVNAGNCRCFCERFEISRAYHTTVIVGAC